MATKFQIKRSSVGGKVPNTSQIDIGELAVNITDRKLFTSNGSFVFEIGANLSSLEVGAIVANGTNGTADQVLTSNGTGVYWKDPSSGAALATIQNTAPSGTAGKLWWDSETGELKIYYNDGDSSQWVDATSKAGPRGVQGPQGPFGPKSATIAFPTASEDLTLFYTNQTVTVSQIASIMRNTGVSNVAFTVRYGSTRSAVGTEIITGGITCTSNGAADVETTFNNATIAANNFVWLETTQINGSVQEFHVTLNFS